MTHNNSTMATDTIVHVEQGPRWLAELLYNPPIWVQQALPLLVGLVGAAAIAAVYIVGLPEDIWPEVAENVGIGASVATLTWMMTCLPGGYVVDAVVGLAVGYPLAVVAVRRAIAPKLWPDVAG